jgi:hypothetical protein
MSNDEELRELNAQYIYVCTNDDWRVVSAQITRPRPQLS